MSKPWYSIKDTALSTKDMVVSFGPFVLLSLILLFLAYFWLDPNPPATVVLAAGPEQSAYDAFAQRYASELRKNGIKVKILPTQGSSENLSLLQEGKADLGFVQGGSLKAQDAANSPETQIQSLGSLFVEPIWIFYREKVAGNKKIQHLSELKGLRVNVDTPGSGIPNLMAQLLEANAMSENDLILSHMAPTPATVAFLDGQVDALVFVSAPESMMVQMLLQTPGVKLLDLAHNEAYARRFNFLTPVKLPRGVVNLANDNPQTDIRLVATTTTLLTREQTHPALVQLFSQAASKLHGGAAWFNQARQYPNAQNLEYPLSKEAERNLQFGPPWLQRYLPFWLANLIERMWLVLGIIVAIILPLSRVIPPLYTFRIRSRVFRWYAQLRELESRSQQARLSQTDLAAVLQELDQLEHQASKVSLPLSYTDELYALRSNIHLVRSKIQEKFNNLPT